jgi:hypothetical protein
VFRAQNPHFSPTRFHEDPKFMRSLQTQRSKGLAQIGRGRLRSDMPHKKNPDPKMPSDKAIRHAVLTWWRAEMSVQDDVET